MKFSPFKAIDFECLDKSLRISGPDGIRIVGQSIFNAKINTILIAVQENTIAKFGVRWYYVIHIKLLRHPLKYLSL